MRKRADIETEEAEATARAILAAEFPGRAILAVRYVGHGAENVVYGASVDARDIVVRMADKKTRGEGQAKDAWCLKRAARAGIPGPTVLATGEVGETVYMVQTFLNGVPGTHPSVDPLMVWRELGRFGGIAHTIDISDYCDRPDDTAARWAKYVSYNIGELTPDDRLIELGVYTMAQQPKIRAVFEHLQTLTYRYGLSHGDLSLRNTMVDASGRVSLYDWGCSWAGITPHVELSGMPTRHAPASDTFLAFLDGYGMSVAHYLALVPEIEMFHLINRIDLVRWSIDRRPEELDAYVAAGRNAVRQVIAKEWSSYRELVKA